MNNSFIINGKLPSLNEYITQCRIHPQKGAKFKREWQQQVEYDILIAKNKKWLTGVNKAVIAHFKYFEKTYKRDLDNVSSFAHKVILDGLVQMCILPNDTQKWVKGFTDSFYHSDKEKIIVILEEWQDDTDRGTNKFV